MPDVKICTKCGGKLERKNGKSGGFGFVKEPDHLVCSSCSQKYDLSGNPLVNSPSGGFGSPSAGPTIAVKDNDENKNPETPEIPGWKPWG